MPLEAKSVATKTVICPFLKLFRASRGIDIEQLPYVINYELPRSPKEYIHRIGRTGRATSSGEAITILTSEDEHHFYIIQKKMGKKVEKIDTKDFDLSKF